MYKMLLTVLDGTGKLTSRYDFPGIAPSVGDTAAISEGDLKIEVPVEEVTTEDFPVEGGHDRRPMEVAHGQLDEAEFEKLRDLPERWSFDRTEIESPVYETEDEIPF